MRAAGCRRRRRLGRTTLTAMLFSGGRAALAHIGDSRAFQLRGGRLRQITEDHTIGNLVADAGLLAPVLARHLDGRPAVRPIWACGICGPGDRYLLRSGGLSPVADDRPHFYVLTLRAASADAPASWPP